VPALLALADSAIAAGDAARARPLYDRALATAGRGGNPAQEASATIGVGRCLVAARRYRDARVAFERAAALDTSRAAPFYHLARAYLDAGEERLAVFALAEGLRREPGEERSLQLLRPLTRSRCEAAGLPPDFGELPSRRTITRGELGVMLAVLLGLDPGRHAWSADRAQPVVPPEVDEAWGARWLRAAVAQGLLRPFPDGTMRLDDPVSRGLFALEVARAGRHLETARTSAATAAGAAGAASAATVAPPRLPDIGPRHYLARAAAMSVRLGLPTHAGGAFDPQAAVAGDEAMSVLDRLAAEAGRSPALPEELRRALVVQ
jgi:tetratricopeptide (TPR) repeat protein